MPIIKETTGIDTAVTVKRFPADAVIAGTDYRSLKYIGINNAHFGDNPTQSSQTGYSPLWANNPGGVVVIRCEIAQNATGEFYGVKSDLHIKKNGSTIEWYNGTTKIGSHAWESGIHMYGFASASSGTKCQPWYDNALVASSSAVTFTPTIPVCIGGAIDSSNLTYEHLTNSSDWAMRLYDVLALQNNSWYHTYPISAGTAGVRLYETRSTLPSRLIRFTAGQGSAVSAGPYGEWGVSIHDLKNAFGVGYNDNLSIVCCDNGLPTTDADPADIINDGTANHTFAFRMASGYGTNVGDTKVNLPSGYTISRTAKASGSYMGNYEFGELIYGRKPKWPLWADGLRVGKYVKQRGSGSTIWYELIYNVFKNHCGKIYTGKKLDNGVVVFSDIGDYNPNNLNDTELLRRFDGISTNSTNIHEPKFNVAREFDIDYHNRVACKCREEDILIGLTYTRYPDNFAVFKYNLNIDAVGYVNVGNLIPWSLTSSELQQDGCNWGVKGVSIKISDNSLGTEFMFVNMLKYASTNAMLCASSPQVDKDTFLNNSIVLTSALANEERLDALYYFLKVLYNNNNNTIPAKASISLLTQWSNVTPTTANTISTDRVMPEKDVTIKGEFDTYVPTTATKSSATTNTRLVVGELGGVATVDSNEYNINIVTPDITDYNGSSVGDIPWYLFELVIQNYPNPHISFGNVMGFQFALERSNALLNLTSKPVIAYVEVTEISTNANSDFIGKYYGFTQPFTIEFDVYEWASPMYESRFWQKVNTAFPSGISGNEDYNKWRACMWRWQELLCNSSTSAAPTGTITAHVKFFPNWSEGTHNEKGPAAWDIHHNGKAWDNSTSAFNGKNTGTPYIELNSKRYCFADSPRIMTYDSGSGGTSIIVDCWFTMWQYSTDQWVQMKGNHPRPALYVKLRKKGIHMPQDHNDPIINVDPSATFYFAQDSGSTITDSSVTNYTATMSTETRYPRFTLLPNGLGQDDLPGFYHLQINVNNAQFEPGTMYTIEFSLNN